jgi:hypothetical protein
MADVFLRAAEVIRGHSHFPSAYFVGAPRRGLKREGGIDAEGVEKVDYRTFIPFSEDEDRAMRRAYGRFASAVALAADAEMVQQFQYKGPGYWIAWGCIDGLEERPPVFIPVLESFIRRHTDPPWPAHTEQCAFFQGAGGAKGDLSELWPALPWAIAPGPAIRPS